MAGTAGKWSGIAAAAGVGLVSGLLSALAFVSGEIDVSNIADLLGLLQSLSPGLIFGLLVGLYLLWRGRTGPGRLLAFIILTDASWYAAFRFAVWADGDNIIANIWLVGLLAGMLGAALLMVSSVLLFPFFRRVRLALAMVALGGAAGLLLGVDSPYPLFGVWQALVAGCYGVALAQAATRRGAPTA